MISIIVPVYNAEKYLRECLDSILVQTYEDIEIILVDDGSLDDSLKICQEYENKDKRIIVYHKENSGVSDTRNYGIEHASGEYISFCDADDAIVPELYEMLYKAMIKYQVDRVVSGYMYLFDDGRTVYSKPRISDGRYNAKYILRKMIDDGTLSGFLFSGVYNSLYKKKIIYENNIRFNTDIKYNEDSLFSLQYMLASKSIYSLQSKPTYFYRQHESSSTKQRTIGDKYETLRNVLCNMDLQNMDMDFEIQMKRRMVTEALWQILDISDKERGVEAIRDIKKILKDKKLQSNLYVIHFKNLNIYKKYYYVLMRLRMAWALYFSSSKLFPILSKYISR